MQSEFECGVDGRVELKATCSDDEFNEPILKQKR